MAAMTIEAKTVLREFLRLAAKQDNWYLADALAMDPDELRRTAREIISKIAKKHAGDSSQ